MEEQVAEQSAHHLKLGWISIVLIGILAVAGGIIWIWWQHLDEA
jgi:hypothetical protein